MHLDRSKINECKMTKKKEKKLNWISDQVYVAFRRVISQCLNFFFFFFFLGSPSSKLGNVIEIKV